MAIAGASISIQLISIITLLRPNNDPVATGRDAGVSGFGVGSGAVPPWLEPTSSAAAVTWGVVAVVAAFGVGQEIVSADGSAGVFCVRRTSFTMPPRLHFTFGITAPI